MSEPIRLAKRVAAMVPCSRREAEQYIEGGWVRVDGQVVEEPQARVTDEQRVELDAGATAANLEPVTLLLHKPAGMSDQQAQQLLSPATRAPDDDSGVRHRQAPLRASGRPAAPAHASQRPGGIQPGRPHRAREPTEDALAIEQELIAQVTGTIADHGLERLAHGLVYEGRPLPPIKVSRQNETRLRFALKGIPPWLVDWMCAQVGLRLVGLKRIRIGRLPMAGLPEGRWRYLRAGERF